ncbi:MAG TPA: TonB-dependent receptor [Candidatus Acidoferrum sp.]|nr:TonB-dependent receptor [Candidatus Acidoferrum sp.]
MSLGCATTLRRALWLATVLGCLLTLTPVAAAAPAQAVHSEISGKLVDPQGVPVFGATVRAKGETNSAVREARTDEQGKFALSGLPPGHYLITAEAAAFVKLSLKIALGNGERRELQLAFQQLAEVTQSITVEGGAPTALAPDPTQRVVVHEQALDANPGRPGAPISIPGLPVETASGGIKAPQYFAPGVAGDHGEPIAQYFAVGGYLAQNNLPANAHGNGYADPNVLIPATIQSVAIDGGAFNVRQGNHSVDLAASYTPRDRLADFVQLTGDYRDLDLTSGWSPASPNANAWLAAEVSYGNGFLRRPEHRQQYKLNGYQQIEKGRHEITLLGIGYYGFSFVPGLIPIGVQVPGDTLDDRQLDRTRTFLLIATDTWKFGDKSQLSFSGLYRNYALTLRSNFGDGLIQQSESRNVAGGEALCLWSFRPWLVVEAGLDLRIELPYDLGLKRLDGAGQFTPVTSNDLTLSFAEPFASADGVLGRHLHYDAGVRQEQVWMKNVDKMNAAHSFDRLATLTLPKATLTFIPLPGTAAPTVAFSYGEAFHTEDPRIGTGNGEPTLLAPSRLYQLRISETLKQIEFGLTLKRASNAQELAKIDPDTGLQLAVGPSYNRVIVVSAQRNFSHGALYASYAQADSRDTLTGAPIPEAPRMIWDVVGSANHLPLGLQARAEAEYVRAKPLGDGFTGVPVRELRGAVARPFRESRMVLGVNFLLARGYTGQTTETVPFVGGTCTVECPVGVPLKSYVSVSWTYSFRK